MIPVKCGKGYFKMFYQVEFLFLPVQVYFNPERQVTVTEDIGSNLATPSLGQGHFDAVLDKVGLVVGYEEMELVR